MHRVPRSSLASTQTVRNPLLSSTRGLHGMIPCSLLTSQNIYLKVSLGNHAGLIETPLPLFTQDFAHKLCEEDGTWFRHPETNKTWSNYTTCVNLDDFEVTTTLCTPPSVGHVSLMVTHPLLHGLMVHQQLVALGRPRNKRGRSDGMSLNGLLLPFQWRQQINLIYETGYTISLVAILFSVGILGYFK